MSKLRETIIFFIFFILVFSPLVSWESEIPAILSMKERAAVVDNWLKIRLDRLLPELMRRENLDMWLVICREYNEDPVYLTLVPYTSLTARRLTMLVFFDRGEGGVERLAVSR